MRRKKRILLLLSFIPFSVVAQEAAISPEQAKKEIRELKLSEKYVYAEASTPISISDAQQNSKDLLQIYIVGILTGQLDLKKREVDKKWEAMENQCQNIVVKNGDLYKVFTYIGKEMVFPDWKKKEPKPQIQVAEKPAEVVPASQALVSPTPVSEPSMPTLEERSEVKSTALNALSDKARLVITTLLELKTFNELITFLEKEMGKGSLAYGSIKNATSLNTSYLSVSKKDIPVIVLDSGTDQRTNFRTGASDSMMNYVGYSIIWFQLF